MNNRTNPVKTIIIALLFTIVAAGSLQAQGLPWSIQTQQAARGGALSWAKIDTPPGDTLHIMALGNGGSSAAVVRTTDGGKTWDQPLHLWDLQFKMNDLSHPTPHHAVIVGDTLYRTADTGTNIQYTHDGGDTWHQAWCDSCSTIPGRKFPLRSVAMADSMNGILTGFAFIMARTTDGGKTWRNIPDPTKGTELFYDIESLNPATYILTASAYLSGIVNLYFTSDSGKTWTRKPTPDHGSFYDFTDPLNGWTAGSYRRKEDNWLMYFIGRTTDAGSTWQTLYDAPILSVNDDNVSAISMADAQHGIIACGGGGWLFTEDGTTWQEGPNLDSVFKVFNLTSVTYPYPGKAWMGDVLGHILVYDPRTASIGNQGAPELPGTIELYPNPTSSYQFLRLRFDLPASARVVIELASVTGEAIGTHDAGILAAGTQVVAITSNEALPPGTYFARVMIGDQVPHTVPFVILQ